MTDTTKAESRTRWSPIELEKVAFRMVQLQAATPGLSDLEAVRQAQLVLDRQRVINQWQNVQRLDPILARMRADLSAGKLDLNADNATPTPSGAVSAAAPASTPAAPVSAASPDVSDAAVVVHRGPISTHNPLDPSTPILPISAISDNVLPVTRSLVPSTDTDEDARTESASDSSSNTEAGPEDPAAGMVMPVIVTTVPIERHAKEVAIDSETTPSSSALSASKTDTDGTFDSEEGIQIDFRPKIDAEAEMVPLTSRDIQDEFDADAFLSGRCVPSPAQGAEPMTPSKPMSKEEVDAFLSGLSVPSPAQGAEPVNLSQPNSDEEDGASSSWDADAFLAGVEAEVALPTASDIQLALVTSLNALVPAQVLDRVLRSNAIEGALESLCAAFEKAFADERAGVLDATSGEVAPPADTKIFVAGFAGNEQRAIENALNGYDLRVWKPTQGTQAFEKMAKDCTIAVIPESMADDVDEMLRALKLKIVTHQGSTSRLAERIAEMA